MLVVLLAGCDPVSFTQRRAATPTSTAGAMPALDVVTPGTLTVGSYTHYFPQMYSDPHTRQAEGFDADLIRAIGKHLGVRVDIVSVEFASLPDYVVNGDVDLAISAIPMTSTLERKVQFVPYFQGGEALLVEQGNPLHIEGVNDLCGKGVAVRADTLEMDDLTMQNDTCQHNKQAAIKIVTSPDQQSMIQLLLKKQVVATYQDAPQADYFIKQYPGSFVLGGPVTNVTVEGIAIRKDNAPLFQIVQQSLKALHTDGTYHALIMKWGLVHEAL